MLIGLLIAFGWSSVLGMIVVCEIKGTGKLPTLRRRAAMWLDNSLVPANGLPSKDALRVAPAAR